MKAPRSISADNNASMQAIGMAFNDRYQMAAVVKALEDIGRSSVEEHRSLREAVRAHTQATERLGHVLENLAGAINRGR